VSLNLKQKAFCEHYVACLNATESAKKAGYSEKTAYSICCENLKKPEIKKYIEELMRNAKSKRIATIDEVLEYLTKTMVDEEVPKKERTRCAQLLLTALALGQSPEGEEGKGELKIVVEERVIDLSKEKKYGEDDKL
jgi:phage terminase small subunit